MNKTIRDGLNGFANGTSVFLGNLCQSIVSILRMSVMSSLKVARTSRKYKLLKTSDNCCVLGNGPSLKDDFEAGRVLTEGNDVFCVNMFCSSPLFKELKPRFYFLIDRAFLDPKTERHRSMVEGLINALNDVDWELFLVISSSAVSGSTLLKSISNEKVKIIYANSAGVSGFKGFRHWVYRYCLGMPRCQTVINFALCFSINMKYKNVYLYGADHTWTRDVFVDEDNVVCYGDRHVYNKNLTVIKKQGNFAQLLDAFSYMFKSHYLLEDYSKSQGVKIWNCSSDSFLDAYVRLKKEASNH